MQFHVNGPLEDVQAICLGSGRFLRAVLVPAFRYLNYGVIVAQTRGRDFVDACLGAKGTYEVDTVDINGDITTDIVQLAAVGTLGTSEGRTAFLQLPFKLCNLQYIGVGVTESGIHPESLAMKDLAAFLTECSQALPDAKLSVINTDNVPANGDMIKKCVLKYCSSEVKSYVNKNVVFHNTMVDRITAARPGNTLVPYAEPLPAKVLVIEDLGKTLTHWHVVPGVVLRHTAGELSNDHLLKLGIANAIHTAMVYYLALSRKTNTKTCAHDPLLKQYIHELFVRDIKPALTLKIPEIAVQSVYDEWIQRLLHPYFGMDTFFVCQNAFAKLKIRLWPSITAQLNTNPSYQPSPMFSFAVALILRFLTPTPHSKKQDSDRGLTFEGSMDALSVPESNESSWVYASDLCADTSSGKYTFRDGDGAIPLLLQNAKSPSNGVMNALQHVCGLDSPSLLNFAADVAALYYRLLNHPASVVLAEVMSAATPKATLSLEDIEKVVRHYALNTPVVDVHTHLFPPSHSELMLWGIDALLTYHYLVAEYLTTASVSPEEFYKWSTTKQADSVWHHLFVDRSPLSEACQGVITTLSTLGLSSYFEKRDLNGIREWFAGQDPEKYVDLVYKIAKIRYVVMTNIPFDPLEAKYWQPTPATYNREQFRTALRIDQVLLGQWSSLGPALDSLNLPHTLEGAECYLLHWIENYTPEYFMASVPSTFQLEDISGITEPSKIIKPSGGLLLQLVILPLAKRLQLPIALKFGAVRGLNPRLCLAGDGVAVVDVSLLTKLAKDNPQVKFLVTFLSRVNQHEVTVVANKFSNVHIYGCWWYCNNPSIITELTRMRLEILGTGFTAQHSDARVLDHLIYKWQHFRTLLVDVLMPLYKQLQRNHWVITESDIKRDIERLLGGSYDEFMAKKIT
ncbi:hypothetical protein THRCLA_11522 [Thraustotheca clavata]|uniref:Mannitol dehydrogenase N-terminal domain-containing protein n=1 Tax=Thraustotheca clavata TaxID=74557 RepID=A0A1V9Y7H4_9STRA|nr:hypothetical protein THRCLA_11522 [Thraustotheca clavata]